MSNLIDRQTAIANINKAIPEWSEDKEIAIDCLKNTPAAQPTQSNASNTLNALDTIYRQAAIDALHGYFDGMLETDTWSPCDVYGLIEILPYAQPEQRWIPCSERLPEDGVRVLITDRDGGIEFGHYEEGEWEWLCESGTNYWSGLNSETVIAWVPLPEPYAERRTDEDNRCG